MIPFITSAYKLLITVGTALQSPFLLIIRLYWGWQFFLTGKGKLTSLDKVTEFFASLHIPLPGFNAAMAGTTEMVGGLLILVGLASRLAAKAQRVGRRMFGTVRTHGQADQRRKSQT